MDFIHTKNAPEPIGAYSQAVATNNLIFLSGQIPLNPQTNEIEASDVRGQTEQVFQNITAVLKEAGCSLNQVLKCTIFLTDINDFAIVNEIYASKFKEHTPARSTIQVGALPKGSLVEIEVIAEKA